LNKKRQNYLDYTILIMEQ